MSKAIDEVTEDAERNRLVQIQKGSVERSNLLWNDMGDLYDEYVASDQLVKRIIVMEILELMAIKGSSAQVKALAADLEALNNGDE